ncbi:hypothetical protein HU200_017536 [Digitaria exilis]|uniref:Uncharacterized protein n=1 Tax=Digitaria exilis TaxID=1010633 RepID=A0A835F6H5_9POAL|nr:hypothetical protein HU200_017536 [Digitaria exilis]
MRPGRRWHAMPEQPLLQPLRPGRGLLRRGVPERRVLPEPALRRAGRRRYLPKQPLLQLIRVLRLRLRVLQRRLPGRALLGRQEVRPGSQRPALP